MDNKKYPQVIRMNSNVTQLSTVRSPASIDPEARQKIANVLHGFLKEISNSAESVSVDFHIGEKTTIFQLHYPQDVCGRIMGSGGKTIDALRIVAIAMAGRHGFRCIIEIPYYPRDDK